MDTTASIDPNYFIHVRIVLSMVVSLSIARLLSGLAKFVQHPDRTKVYSVHIIWVFFMLILLIHFWWWEFALSHISTWQFGTFAFVIGYASLLYLLCAILFPDNLFGYTGYNEYFTSRRSWFFGILALVYVCDYFDTWLKGSSYLAGRGAEYPIRTLGVVLLCMAAIKIKNLRFHQVFAAGLLLYEISWITRHYIRLE